MVLAVIGISATALVLFFVDPARVPIFPICQFHRLTGWDCPGCGGTRALHALLHGHVKAAFHLNAFLVASVPLFGVVGLRRVWLEWQGKPAPGIRTAYIWLYLAAFVVFGVVRNLPVPKLAAFAP